MPWLSIAVLIMVGNAMGGGCSGDWLLKNGHCYRMFEEAVTMSEAKAKCAEENSNPVSIGSKEEYTFIYTLFNGGNYAYIGLTYTDNGSWKWFDGSSLSSEPMSDEPIWVHGYPKNESHDRCVIMLEASRSWKNVNCNMKHYFICEYDSTTVDSNFIGIIIGTLLGGVIIGTLIATIIHRRRRPTLGTQNPKQETEESYASPMPRPVDEMNKSPYESLKVDLDNGYVDMEIQIGDVAQHISPNVYENGTSEQKPNVYENVQEEQGPSGYDEIDIRNVT
ncbi:hypothetical protein CAPTEDRAFT_204685 [Capitella teleta]|uniref:C-type lectin domain-containing protein n=1 Tax=Capitella teleta TaxID=283909 RepID=R7U9P2_CAPTE|nr:hypothetical protein CAPTEDRAFT_204685 [Capitella teleta]|eukprot:ELU03080.1 hypothetical protein CAPTEDRAFT_204685 [Capitella teleta]